MATAALLVFRAMHSNRFFSSVVRIREDRGHRVVESGPYSRVRHPGYAGMIPLMAFRGSRWDRGWRPPSASSTVP